MLLENKNLIAENLLKNKTLEEIELIADLVISKEINTARDLQDHLGISFSQAVSIISNNEFMQLVQSKRMAIEKFGFINKSMKKLSTHVDHMDAETSIKAINSQADILGFRKKDNVSVNLSIESILTKINNKEKVIDVEAFPGLE